MRAFQVDDEKLRQQLPILFPKLPASLARNWSWVVKKTLSNHILIELTFINVIPTLNHIIVWSKEGTAWLLYSLDRFKELVEIEDLDLRDNLQDILEIFTLCFDLKHILQDITDMEKIVWLHNRDQLSKYKDAIHPPIYSIDNNKMQARFWTIEFTNGNLEEWSFTQQGKSMEIQSWVREENFIANIGGIG